MMQSRMLKIQAMQVSEKQNGCDDNEIETEDAANNPFALSVFSQALHGNTDGTLGCQRHGAFALPCTYG